MKMSVKDRIVFCVKLSVFQLGILIESLIKRPRLESYDK